MSRDFTFDHAPEDIPDGVIHDLAVSFLRHAQELFAQPDTQGRYLQWRREQFRLGNPLGLTPIPDDLLL